LIVAGRVLVGIGLEDLAKASGEANDLMVDTSGDRIAAGSVPLRGHAGFWTSDEPSDHISPIRCPGAASIRSNKQLF